MVRVKGCRARPALNTADPCKQRTAGNLIFVHKALQLQVPMFNFDKYLCYQYSLTTVLLAKHDSFSYFFFCRGSDIKSKEVRKQFSEYKIS